MTSQQHHSSIFSNSLAKWMISLLVCLMLCAPASAQYINTIAGNGVSACYQNDLPGTCTPFAYPVSACVAPNGDVYITCGNAIKKLSAATGIVTRVAGSDSYGGSGDGGPAINALFQFTRSVRMDKKGDLYIAEYSGHRIRKITMSTGIITTIAGNGSAGYSGDGGPAVSSKLNTPSDLSIDADGNIFIADYLNARVRKIDAATGIITTVAGNGNVAYSGDNGPATSAAIPQPNSICHDANGNLYISEAYSGISCRIRKVNAVTGIITTIAGTNAYAYSGDGGLAINANLFDPAGVAADAAGNIYISEYDDSRIRKIDAVTGIITTFAGIGINGFIGDGGPAANAALHYPMGLSFDQEGSLYVCDNNNLRVRKISVNANVPPPVNTPTIVISASTTAVCNSDPVDFTAATTSAGINPSYQWKKNGAAVGTNAATYSGSGFTSGDVITCTLTFAACIGTSKVTSNSITITSGIAAAPSISIVASDTTICKSEHVVFKATPANAASDASYQWKLNGTNTGNNNPVFNTSGLNNGDVVNCVLTSGPVSCSPGGSASSGNIVMEVSAPLPISVIIEASGNDICPGTAVDFDAIIQNGGSSPVYQWKLNDANAGDNADRYSAADPANNDQVFCIVTTGEKCTPPVTSNVIKMVVKNIPSIKIYPADTLVVKGSQVQLQAMVDGPVEGFAWTPASGVRNGSVLDPVTIPLLTKTAYTFRITTADNCVDSLTTLINVQQKIFIPNSFTPNDDGVNDVFRINPDATVRVNEFAVFNRWGQKIFSTSDIRRGWNGTYKNAPQPVGVYVYMIQGNDEQGPVSLKGSFVLIR